LTDVLNRYADVAGIDLGYVEEPGVSLPGMVIRQKTMIDALTDLLRQVTVLGGGTLKLRAREGKLECIRPGANSTIYAFKPGGAAIQSTIKGSIEAMIDKVIVLGHGSDDQAQPVVATRSTDAGFTGAQEIVYAETDSEDATDQQA